MKITKSQLKQIIKEEIEESTWDNYEKIGVRSLPPEEKNALAAAAIDVVMRDPKFIKKATELARKYLWDPPTRTQTAAGAHGSGVESVKDFTRSQGQAKSFEDKNQQTGRLKVNPLPVYLIPLKDVVEGKLGWTEDFPTGRPGVWSPYKSVLYAPLVDAWLEKMRPSDYKELGDLGYLRKQIGSFNQETYEQILQELSAKEYIPKLSALRDGLVGLEYDKNTNEELLESLKRAYSALTKHVWPRSSPATRPRLGPSRPPGITSHLGGGMGGGMRFEGKMKITRRQLKQIIKEELEKVLSEAGEERWTICNSRNRCAWVPAAPTPEAAVRYADGLKQKDPSQLSAFSLEDFEDDIKVYRSWPPTGEPTIVKPFFAS